MLRLPKISGLSIGHFTVCMQLFKLYSVEELIIPWLLHLFIKFMTAEIPIKFIRLVWLLEYKCVQNFATCDCETFIMYFQNL